MTRGYSKNTSAHFFDMFPSYCFVVVLGQSFLYWESFLIHLCIGCIDLCRLLLVFAEMCHQGLGTNLSKFRSAPPYFEPALPHSSLMYVACTPVEVTIFFIQTPAVATEDFVGILRHPASSHAHFIVILPNVFDLCICI